MLSRQTHLNLHVAPSMPLPDEDRFERAAERQFERKRHIFRAYQVVWYVAGVIEVLLAFRLLLRALGANPASGFSQFIYGVSGPFAIPFVGVVAPTVAGRAVIEWSTLLAMLVYMVVAFGIVKLMQFVKPVEAEEVERTVDSEV